MPKATAGPVDESTGQRSVFPQVMFLYSRDSEWQYGDGQDEQEQDGDVSEVEDLARQTFSSNMLDCEEMEMVEEGEGQEGLEEAESNELDEDEWEVEPQTDATAYLHSVRAEAEGLPALTYITDDVHSPKKLLMEITGPSESDNLWQSQFLQYYKSLRETFANTPEPNLSQGELDALLHIDPNNRPNTSNQEDRLWRLKTLDQPSVTLLSMLDHQPG